MAPTAPSRAEDRRAFLRLVFGRYRNISTSISSGRLSIFGAMLILVRGSGEERKLLGQDQLVHGHARVKQEGVSCSQSTLFIVIILLLSHDLQQDVVPQNVKIDSRSMVSNLRSVKLMNISGGHLHSS